MNLFDSAESGLQYTAFIMTLRVFLRRISVCMCIHMHVCKGDCVCVCVCAGVCACTCIAVKAIRCV